MDLRDDEAAVPSPINLVIEYRELVEPLNLNDVLPMSALVFVSLALILNTKSVKVAGIDEKVTDAAELLRTLDEISV